MKATIRVGVRHKGEQHVRGTKIPAGSYAEILAKTVEGKDIGEVEELLKREIKAAIPMRQVTHEPGYAWPDDTIEIRVGLDDA